MKTCPLCDTAYPNHHTNCDNDGSLLIECKELEPGAVIRGKYRIVCLLGRGGMGTVYLAEHILLGQQRALKFISSELAQDAHFLRRFRHEAQAAITLRHPNIVEVVDLDQAEDGSPYIAMEYVEGLDLRHALADGALPVERALAILRGLALGLGAAHAKGIVHRDVKPENILLAGGDGVPETPKLLDFGIATMKEGATAISRTRGLMLTPQYAAPEQWKGLEAKELDGRVDLYALGGVLYEMLTGQTSFNAHNTEGWMYQHLQVEPEAPSHLRLELTNWPGLDPLVLRLLAKDREQRPKDTSELVSALDELGIAASVCGRETKRDGTLSHAIDEFASKGPKTTRSRSVRLGLLATGGLLLFALGVWFTSRLIEQHNGTVVVSPSAVLPSQAKPLPEQSATLKPINPDTSTTPQPHSSKNEKPVDIVAPLSPNAVPTQPKPSQVEPSTPPAPKPTTAELDNQAKVLFDQKRYGEAAPLYDQACSGGLGRACNWLGLMYQHGDGLAKDNSQAAALYSKGCDAGDANACANVGFMYSVGTGVPKDDSKSAAFFTKACDGGAAIACANLGYSYQNGLGVVRNVSRAAMFYSKACDTGEPMGCVNLGYLYGGGEGVPKDEARAATLFSKSCDVGYPTGCFNLGNSYVNGIGVPKDASRAAALFSKACDRGIPEGCGNLGMMYEDGNGVAQNYSRAATFYSKGCEAGVGPACRRLGLLYMKGNGVTKDNDKARELLSQSCSMKDAVGCAFLKTGQ